MQRDIHDTKQNDIRKDQQLHEDRNALDRIQLLDKPALSPTEFWHATQKVMGMHAIYARLETGELKSFSIGRKRLIPTSEATAFFEREASK